MHDALKNVTSIFDGQQKQQARYEYAPFGSPITEEGGHGPGEQVQVFLRVLGRRTGTCLL